MSYWLPDDRYVFPSIVIYFIFSPDMFVLRVSVPFHSLGEIVSLPRN